MIRLSTRSTASILALATVLGYAGAAQAAVTITDEAVTIDGAAEPAADAAQDNSASTAPEDAGQSSETGLTQ